MTPTSDVSGTSYFDGANVEWDWTIVIGGSIDMNDACASAVIGEPVDAVEACPMLGRALVDTGTFALALCYEEAATCICDVNFPTEYDAGTSSYEIADNQFILSDGEAIDYCSTDFAMNIQTSGPDGVLTIEFDEF